MYRIEKRDDVAGRWVPAGPGQYRTERDAEHARRICVEDALREASNTDAWKTPRFRIVEARHVVACATVQ